MRQSVLHGIQPRRLEPALASAGGAAERPRRPLQAQLLPHGCGFGFGIRLGEPHNQVVLPPSAPARSCRRSPSQPAHAPHLQLPQRPRLQRIFGSHSSRRGNKTPLAFLGARNNSGLQQNPCAHPLRHRCGRRHDLGHSPRQASQNLGSSRQIDLSLLSSSLLSSLRCRPCEIPTLPPRFKLPQQKEI